MKDEDIKAAVSEIPEYLKEITEYAFEVVVNSYRAYEASELNEQRITFSAHHTAREALYTILFPMFSGEIEDTGALLRNWVLTHSAIEQTVKYCAKYPDTDRLEKYIRNLSVTLKRDIKFNKENY